MKNLILAIAFFFALPALADTAPTQTWNVSAVCDDQIPNVAPSTCAIPVNLSAVFITQMETGTFLDVSSGLEFTGTEAVVTNITGSFDGMAMSLIADSPLNDWISGGIPNGGVEFSADGQNYFLYWDGVTWLLPLTQSIGNFPNGESVDWSAVDPPPVATSEADSMLMAIVGLVAVWASVLICAEKKTKKAKVKKEPAFDFGMIGTGSHG